jgi:Zn-dependent protease with chaperone function
MIICLFPKMLPDPALGVCVMMDYVVGRDYELIRLSLWEYVLLRFRFLFILFLVPVAIAVVIGAIVTTYYSEPLVWYVLLFRTLAFAVLIVFAGFVLPYLFGKISGAESVEQETPSLAYDIAEKMGVTIQGVYRVPLEGLRRANAVQVGFLEEKKVVYLLGGWKKYFKKNEIKAVLAHEFAHAVIGHFL